MERRTASDTPISEQAILGAAMGAAMTGLRPIAEIMFSDFFAVCWDFVANVVAPSTPRDLIGLMAASVRDPDPVLLFEHKALYPSKGEVPTGEIVDELGTARVLREGSDATVVALAIAATIKAALG